MKARKRFAQHFLEAAWVRKLVDLIAPSASEAFLEIGPGRGALTLPLAARAREVVAVEIDRDLAGALAAAAPPNVRVVAADFLDIDVRAIAAATGPLPIRVVGNLPYNVSSPILFRLLRASGGGQVVADATLMLQREVADRLAARPGTREGGVLSILMQVGADVSRRMTLPPGAFRPAPRVSSAVVQLRFHPPQVPLDDPAAFEALVRGLFTHRRKTVLNALGSLLAEADAGAVRELLAKVGIDPGRRPETLHLAELARLAQHFPSAARPRVL